MALKIFQYRVDVNTAVPRTFAIGLLFGVPSANLRNKVKSARIVVFSSLIAQIVPFILCVLGPK